MDNKEIFNSNKLSSHNPQDFKKMAITANLDILSFPLLLLLLPPLIFILLKILNPPSPNKVPPGPRPWPILGNLHQLGRNAHISVTNLAKIHGPLMSLKLGSQPLVVASSPVAAAAVLKTEDRLLSARYILQMTPNLSLHNNSSLVFSPHCNDHWKSLRSICRANLFNAKSIESQAGLRARKIDEMVEFLDSKQGSVVEIKDFVFTTVFNTISNLIFSRDLLGFCGDGFHGIKVPFKKMMDLGLTPNLADLYPWLRRFDLQGLRTKARVYKKEVDSSWESLIQERRRIHLGNGSVVGDFLDVMIQSGFSDQQISHLAVELLSAGTDTTTTTIEWALTELLKNRAALSKAQQELKAATTKQKPTLEESQIPKLQYLQSCIKEALRLHPPAPFLLPRTAPQACNLMGYTIPKNALIFVNVWGIGRDPSVWEDCGWFDPDRFADCDVGFSNGFDFGYLPFGGGRRMCPGLAMAAVQVPLILGTLVHCFDWVCPKGGDLGNLGLEGRLGVTLQKDVPLQLVPTRRIL